MRRRSLVLRCALAVVVLLAGVPQAAAGAPDEPRPAVRHVASLPGRVLVRFRDDSSRARGRTLSAHGLRESDLALHGHGLAGVRVPNGRSRDVLIAELRADPNVLSAEPILLRYPSAYVPPDDPAYIDATVRQSGDTSSTYGRSWWLRDYGVNAASVWAHGFSDPAARDYPTRAAASAFKVGVIDTGFYMSHPDRGTNIVAGHDFLDHFTENADGSVTAYEDDDVTPPPDDAVWRPAYSRDTNIFMHSHGTCTAGEVAAATLNGVGVASVGYENQVVVYKVAGVQSSNHSVRITSEALTAAIERAADDGCKVISLSLGGDTPSDAERAAVNYARGKGAIVVAATGNSGVGNVDYPAGYSGVVGVGSFGFNANRSPNRFRSSFSNYGPGLDILAPGEMVWGLAKPGWSSPTPGSEPGYSMWGGTSMATPAIAGAIAHLWRYIPSLSGDKLVDLVQRAAVPVGTGQPNADYGWGYLDMSRAMASIMSTYAYLTAPVLHMPATPLPGGYTVAWDAVPGHSVVYEVSLDGSLVATTTGTSRVVHFDAGAHTVRVQATSALDYWDAMSASTGITTAYEPTEPWSDVEPAGWVTTRTPSLTVRVRDAVTGLAVDSAEARTSSHGGAIWTAWAPAALALGASDTDTATVSATVTFTADSAEADQVQFRVRDNASHLGTSPVFTVPVDATAPTGDFTLAGGASETATNVVQVTSAVSDVSALRMQFSTDGGATWSDPAPYAESTSVALPRVNGTYDIRARYSDEASNTLERARSITLTIAPPHDWARVGGTGWSASRTVAVTVQVRDAVSGLVPASAALRYTSDGGASWSAWVPASMTGGHGSAATETISATVPFAGDSATADQVQFRVENAVDMTGTSPAFTVKVDSTPPAGTLTLGDGSGKIATTTVPVLSAVSDMTTLQMRLSTNGGSTWSSWSPYVARAEVVLPDANGDYDVRAQYRDEAGNTLALARPIAVSVPASLARVAGPTRYETALATSRAHFAHAQTVVIATGAEFADALSAAALAGSYDAPLLLTPPAALHPGIIAEIARLGATHAVIVGSEAAVSGGVYDALVGLPGMSVDRIAGPDRYATSAAIAVEVARHEEALGRPLTDEYVLARGDVFADALAASPVAYARRMPILLTRPTGLPPVAVETIQSLWPDNTRGTAIVAGSKAAVGTEVTERLDLDGRGWVRVEGQTRYDTAAALADYAAAHGWASWRFVGVATGANFPDALGGGAAAGASGGVLLLTQPASLSPQVSTRLAAHRSVLRTVEVFGGPPAVAESVVTALTGATR